MTTALATPSDDLAILVRRARLAAIAFGVLSYLAAVALRYSVRHVVASTHYPSTLTILVGFVSYLLFGLLYSALVSQRRCPAPAAFQLKRGDFVSPLPPSTNDLAILWIGYIGATAFPTSNSGHLSLDIAIAAVLTLVSVAVGLCFMYGRKPRLVLGPRDLASGRNTIPWDALLPGAPTPPTGKPNQMWLGVSESLPLFAKMLDGPQEVHPAPGYRWFGIGLKEIFVDRAFLAFAIGYYAVNPESRASIGTPEGHAELSRAYVGQAA